MTRKKPYPLRVLLLYSAILLYRYRASTVMVFTGRFLFFPRTRRCQYQTIYNQGQIHTYSYRYRCSSTSYVFWKSSRDLSKTPPLNGTDSSCCRERSSIPGIEPSKPSPGDVVSSVIHGLLCCTEYCPSGPTALTNRPQGKENLNQKPQNIKSLRATGTRSE